MPRFSAPNRSVISGRADDAPNRDQEIARLVGLWPAEISDLSADGRARLIKKLEQVLKAERLRGRAGHWTYDLARHAALVRVLRRERAALALQTGAAHKSRAGFTKENAPGERPARSISKSCPANRPGRPA